MLQIAIDEMWCSRATVGKDSSYVSSFSCLQRSTNPNGWQVLRTKENDPEPLQHSHKGDESFAESCVPERLASQAHFIEYLPHQIKFGRGRVYRQCTTKGDYTPV